VTWGNPDGMEAAALVAAVRPLMPPPPPGAAGPFLLSDESAVRKFASDARLKPVEVFDVDSSSVYADEATAERGLNSSGVAARAMEHSSEQAVTERTSRRSNPSASPTVAIASRRRCAACWRSRGAVVAAARFLSIRCEPRVRPAATVGSHGSPSGSHGFRGFQWIGREPHCGGCDGAACDQGEPPLADGAECALDAYLPDRCPHPVIVGHDLERHRAPGDRNRVASFLLERVDDLTAGEFEAAR
jgi:hypothetical protein